MISADETDKEALAAEGPILHALDIVDEVPQLLFYGLGLGFADALPTGLSDQLLHFVVEQSPGPASESLFVIRVLFAPQQRRQYFARVFERMIEVDYLNGSWEAEPPHVGQALGSVNEQHLL